LVVGITEHVVRGTCGGLILGRGTGEPWPSAPGRVGGVVGIRTYGKDSL
jgi:hypothetical protein